MGQIIFGLGGFGTGGGAGFTVGPPDNIFGTTSGDISDAGLSITAGANRAAAESTRDTYFTNNPADLAVYDTTGNEALGIYLYYDVGGTDTLIGQTRVNDAWIDNVSVAGVRGQPGTVTDFTAVGEDNIPVIGPSPGFAPLPSGLTVDTTNRLISTPMSLRIAPSSLQLGDGQTISTGVRFVNFKDPTGSLAYAQGILFDDTGNTQPFYFALAARTAFPVSDVSDTVLADPQVMQFAPAASNSMGRAFIISPATYGTLRVRAWLGTSVNDPMVVDNPYPIEVGDLNSDLTLEIPNPPFTFIGDRLRVEFSGIQLNGGLQTSGPFDTQIVPRLGSEIHGGTQVTLADDENLTALLEAKVGTAQLDYNALKNRPVIGETNVQSDWNEANTAADSFIQNKPTIPTPRTDEEIRDTIGATLVAGMNIQINVDDTNDQITISATGGSGGGTPPDADNIVIYFGLMDTNEPATVNIATLTDEGDPTDPDTIQIGIATQGQYGVILVEQANDLVSIFDTVLNQDVTSIFIDTDNVRNITDPTHGTVNVPFKSYVIGPLNAGFNETYVLNFS